MQQIRRFRRLDLICFTDRGGIQSFDGMHPAATCLTLPELITHTRGDFYKPMLEWRAAVFEARQGEISLYEHILNQLGLRVAVARESPHETCDARLVPLEQ